MKIVYCVDSIRYMGGIQRVTPVKANALAEIPGNEVYIVVADHQGGPIQTAPSDKVHLIDLGVNYYDDDWKGRLQILKGIFIKRRQHKKRLKAMLQDIQPDIVIGVGLSEKNFLPSIKGKWKVIREFHTVRNYRKKLATNFFYKILAYFGDWMDNHVALRKYDCIVTLTEEDKKLNWNDLENFQVVPNPVSFLCNDSSELNSRTIISVGRLSYPKNYESLIRAFAKVHKTNSDWKLMIVGDGSDRKSLEDLILSLQLSDCVELPGYSNDVQSEMLKASVFVMSSRMEGFPLVLVEAMECGLPIVSYACPCGPKDIISDGVDGFLVEPNNEEELAEKINELIENESLRKEMGLNAKKKASEYHPAKIAERWMDLFNNLISNN